MTAEEFAAIWEIAIDRVLGASRRIQEERARRMDPNYSELESFDLATRADAIMACAGLADVAPDERERMAAKIREVGRVPGKDLN